MRIAHRVRKFVEHPFIKLMTGVLLAYAGISEAFRALEEDVASQGLGIHHAVAIFGIVRILETLPEILEGLDRMAVPFDNEIKRRRR